MSEYFCGWYFKCQSELHTIAVIPAEHKSDGNRSCSIQLITDDGAWNISFPYEDYVAGEREATLKIGDNIFCRKGMSLRLNTPELTAWGIIRFGKLSAIEYDIMGPFRYVPFMECRHSVVSMVHAVNGSLSINGKEYRFMDGSGYIEGDRGRSFPKEYAWTQCFCEGNSIMLSVADIPFGQFSFTGMIGTILWKGKEYRIASYLGAKAEKIKDGEIIIRQGGIVLTVKLLEKHPLPLFAPIEGSMRRTIHESAECRAFYSLTEYSQTIFSFETSRASFEYEYPC